MNRSAKFDALAAAMADGAIQWAEERCAAITYVEITCHDRGHLDITAAPTITFAAGRDWRRER